MILPDLPLLKRLTGNKVGGPANTCATAIRVVTVASKGGSANHPKWFLNLEANPECEVEIGSEKRRMRARRATKDEKAKYWPPLVEMYPDYGCRSPS